MDSSCSPHIARTVTLNVMLNKTADIFVNMKTYNLSNISFSAFKLRLSRIYGQKDGPYEKAVYFRIIKIEVNRARSLRCVRFTGSLAVENLSTREKRQADSIRDLKWRTSVQSRSLLTFNVSRALFNFERAFNSIALRNVQLLLHLN